MKKFKDSKGREWEIAVNVGTIRSVRAACGIDLIDAALGATAIKLAENPCLVGDVLWALVKKQAEVLRVSGEDFAYLLSGDVLKDATDALLEDLMDFFPNPETRRALRAAMAIATQNTRQKLELAMSQLEALQKSPNAENSTDGKPSGNALESSESPLGTSHSESSS